MSNLRMLFTRTAMPKYNTFEDFRTVAKRRVPKMVFDFGDGGADGEISLRANRDSFSDVTFDPRWMSDVSRKEIATTVLGEKVSMPYLLAPAGLASVVHKEGELAVARAAAEMDTIFCISTGSAYSLEEIAAAAPSCKLWFQLYLWKSEEVVLSLIDRAKATGCKALVLTIDVPAVGKRERDLVNGMSLPPRIRPSNVVDAMWRFRWLQHFITGNEITFGNLRGVAAGDDASTVGEYTSRELVDPTVTWERLDWLRRKWDGPLAVKGVLSARDAIECVNRGADAVYVSNHGGRQLDQGQATVKSIAELAKSCKGRIKLMMDSGIRSGSDIAVSIASGAEFTFLGRAPMYGVCAMGSQGGTQVVEILQKELQQVMEQLGCEKLEDLPQHLV